MRRLARLLAIVIALIVFFKLYIYVYGHIEIWRLEDSYGASTVFNEDLFSREFPSARQIEQHLANQTIVVTEPTDGMHIATQNSVIYFDEHHHIFRWFGADRRIFKGIWAANPGINVLEYDDRWRVVLGYLFCTWYYDENPATQQENCTIPSSIDTIITAPGTKQYVTGDIFELSTRKRTPFALPNAPFTVGDLLRLNASEEIK